MSDTGLPGGPHEGLVAGRFRVIGLLGSGATASVFEALDTVEGGRVAVKVLHPHLSQRPALREAFLREARTVAGVRHPSLCTVVGSGVFEAAGETQTWTAWQLAPGVTLGEQVRERGVLRPEAAVDVASRVLSGLGELHAAGLVHRDISPSNVVVDVDAAGRVRDARVIDFGLVDEAGASTRAGDVLRSTQGEGVVGNVQYAAPELLRGEGVGPRADLYQLAGVLYFALVGSPPFPRDSSDATIRAHQSAAPPIASVSVAGVPVALDRAIVRAMLKDPEARFATADEMGAAVRAAVASRAMAVTAPSDRTSTTRVLGAAAPAPVVAPVVDEATSHDVPAGRASSPWLWTLGLLAAVMVLAVVVALTPRMPGDDVAQIPLPAETTAPPLPSTASEPSPSAPQAALVEVPLLEGLGEQAARRVVEAAGLTVGTVRVVDTAIPGGTVLGSDPAAGVHVVTGASVGLDLASGANTVPDVFGWPETAAVDAVAAAGLAPVVTKRISTAAAGTVVEAQPAAPTSMPLGASVVLVIAAPAPTATTVPTPTPIPTRTPTSTPTPAPTP